MLPPVFPHFALPTASLWVKNCKFQFLGPYCPRGAFTPHTENHVLLLPRCCPLLPVTARYCPLLPHIAPYCPACCPTIFRPAYGGAGHSCIRDHIGGLLPRKRGLLPRGGCLMPRIYGAISGAISTTPRGNKHHPRAPSVCARRGLFL